MFRTCLLNNVAYVIASVKSAFYHKWVRMNHSESRKIDSLTIAKELQLRTTVSCEYTEEAVIICDEEVAWLKYNKGNYLQPN